MDKDSWGDGGLLDDLFVDILLRLPVKSILRFKSVCKSWNTVIKDRFFVKLQLNRAVVDNMNLGLMMIRLPITRQLFTIELNASSESVVPCDGYWRFIVWGSCNGILLEEFRFANGCLRLFFF